MVYNGYYKVMSNIPKMGHLPTPGINMIKYGQIIGVDLSGQFIVNLKLGHFEG